MLGASPTEIVKPAVATRQLLASGLQPRAAANPMTGGWLVSSVGGYIVQSVAVDAELTELSSRQVLPALQAGDVTSYLSSPFDTAVACPAWTSLPVVDMRFEELPDAVDFVDSSRFANDATFDAGARPDPAVPGRAGGRPTPTSVCVSTARATN